MSAQIISLRLIALAGPLLLCGVGFAVSTNPAPAAECLGAPTSGPPEGSHWYYRTDRAIGRKCWFLRALNPAAQDTVAQEDAPPARRGAIEQPAPASAGAHVETSAAKSPAPPAAPKPQPTTSVSSATPQEPVRQPAQEESAAPPIPQAPAPQPTPPRQTNAYEPSATPVAPIAWPDPPAVANVEAQKPNPVPKDAPPHAIPATVGARAADDPEGIAQIGARAGDAAKTTSASAGTLAEILLIVMLALTAAGLLYRWVAKITAARDRRILMDHSGLDWVHDDRQEHQFGGEQRQRGFVNEREKFVDDLRLSLVPAADDYGARRPRQIAPQSDGLREGRAPRIADVFAGRENQWAQLLRDLDQIMQSRKEA
jgi:hypothetical protein